MKILQVLAVSVLFPMAFCGSIHRQKENSTVHRPTTALELHVDGRHLKSENGDIVRLQGLHTTPHPHFTGGGKFWNDRDYEGCLEYLESVIDTLTDPSPKYGFKHGWYGNQLRMDSGNEYWAQIEESSDDHSRPLDMVAFKDVTERILVPLVKYAKTKGMYILLFPGVGIPAESTTPEVQKKLLDAWDYWSSHPALRNAANVHFEICNEPINAQATDGSWGNGAQKYTDALVEWLQPIVDKIRQNGARNVIWIPGLAWQSDYAGFVKNPVKGGNIGYSVHFYPAYGGMGDDHEKIRAFWNKNYQPVGDKYPINITEILWQKRLAGDHEYWGLFDGVTGNDKSGFGTAVHEILSQHSNVSWSVHLTGPVFVGADPNGKLNHEPERDNCALPAFKWFYEFRNTRTE